MSDLSYSPGPSERTVRDASGKVIDVPAGWELLPPGDAMITRRVKAAGDHWVVTEKRGRRVFSQGIWADAKTIAKVRGGVDAERSTDAYAKKREADTKRREVVQEQYVEDFTAAVLVFLNFHWRYSAIAQTMAQAISDHSTPVGSGTVARTKRIPVEQRAEAAVIAWMRHQTTGYDSMVIPRIQGKRREVRRMLAARSKELLAKYRAGLQTADDCPLMKAVQAES
ncbi:MAG TPA: DUF2293 domain-containing protein [Planctomycetaceae bacterium]|nr:DUF2293 domain-containing protein [Planctomycetaceae bacterium]